MSYSLWTGKASNFLWLASNAALAQEILAECPELVEGKYVVMPTFDGVSLIAERGTQYNERWMVIGAPRIVASPTEIPWSGNGEELCIFENKPDDEVLQVLGRMHAKLAALDPSEPEPYLDEFGRIGVESYVMEGPEFFLATRNKDAFDRILKSRGVTELPQRRKREIERFTRLEIQALGPEVGPEKCKDPGCNRLRIALGVFCAEHHLKMLHESRCRAWD